MKTIDAANVRLWGPATLVLVLTTLSQILEAPLTHGQSADVWFGTQKVDDDGMQIGIYHASLKLDDGALSVPKLRIALDAPGFLAVNPNPVLQQRVLYAITKIDGQAVIASLNVADDKSLKLLNAQSIGENLGSACHIAVDATGTLAVTSQYGSGTVAVFSLSEDGSITQRTQLIRHAGGAKVVGKRQESPHAHYCGFDGDNQFAFICDLGMDRVKIYKIDHHNRKLVEHGEAICPPGSGPRHMKFHPGGKQAFVLHELSMTLGLYDYDASTGVMKLKQTIKTIPDLLRDQEVFNSASEVLVHPTGKFIYSANRGNDSVTVFRFNQQAASLERIQVEPMRGSWPRHINLSPDGKWLIAAGRDSNSAAPFQIDTETGRLTYVRGSRFVPHPICVLFTGE